MNEARDESCHGGRREYKGIGRDIVSFPIIVYSCYNI